MKVSVYNQDDWVNAEFINLGPKNAAPPMF